MVEESILSKIIKFILILGILTVLILLFLPYSTPPIPPENAVKEIGNTISSNSNAWLMTKDFIIDSRQIIKSEEFVSRGIDPCAIYFDTSAFGSNDDGQIIREISIEADDTMQCTSKVINTTNSQVRARATVVCGLTPAGLMLILDNSKLLDKLEVTPEEFWPDSENVDYTKYCVVIIKRA